MVKEQDVFSIKFATQATASFFHQTSILERCEPNNVSKCPDQARFCLFWYPKCIFSAQHRLRIALWRKMSAVALVANFMLNIFCLISITPNCNLWVAFGQNVSFDSAEQHQSRAPNCVENVAQMAPTPMSECSPWIVVWWGCSPSIPNLLEAHKPVQSCLEGTSAFRLNLD